MIWIETHKEEVVLAKQLSCANSQPMYAKLLIVLERVVKSTLDIILLSNVYMVHYPFYFCAQPFSIFTVLSTSFEIIPSNTVVLHSSFPKSECL
jgi:hypothetical protein